MHYSLLKTIALAALTTTVVALPPSIPKSKVVKTTVLPNGQIIDWVPIEAQGDIAAPPPVDESHVVSDIGKALLSASIPSDPSLRGPPGTVPFVRSNLRKSINKMPPPGFRGNVARGTGEGNIQGEHWYCTTTDSSPDLGGGAIFSLYKPYVETTDDFSLLQMAVIRVNAANAQYGKVIQTLESGWIHYERQTKNPHIFTFFNTNGYNTFGDDEMGWNTEVTGWKQVDKDIYPGFEVTPLSERGGEQHDLKIEYKLYQSNWWLYVAGKGIGYYPASLFSKKVKAADTLATKASQINFYGEVTNSKDTLTTTDMGSGAFPEAGRTKAAYMRNIKITDASGKSKNYNGVDGNHSSDEKRYRMLPKFNSGEDWESYIVLGGPGAGGVIDG